MNKFSKAFKAFRMIMAKPYLLNLILEDEEEMKKHVNKNHNFPHGLPSVSLLELFPKFENVVEPFSFLDGSSLPTDMALLRGLAQQLNCTNYFEIGTWRGESLANVAAVAEHCVSMNLPDCEMKQLGLSDDYIAIHRHFSKDLKNAEHIQANSLTFDFENWNRKFDLIFIDGDHHYQSIKSDTINAFKLLKDENSIIVWHDYGIGTETVRWSVLAGILDGCSTEQKGKLYHVSNTLCAMYTNKSLKSSTILPNQQAENYYSLHIKAKK